MINNFRHAVYRDALRIMVLILFCSLVYTGNAYGQAVEDTVIVLTADTTKVKTKKGSIFSGRPGKSLLMSLVVPGAGQIYNKSYLRVPFVWAAIGGVGYLVIDNTQKYKCRRDAYIAAVDGTPYVPAKYCKDVITTTDPARIRALRDTANSNRQLSIVAFSAVWLLNGVDAFVDAHLKEFDIDEDLSIDIGPIMDDDPNAPMRVGMLVKF